MRSKFQTLKYLEKLFSETPTDEYKLRLELDELKGSVAVMYVLLILMRRPSGLTISQMLSALKVNLWLGASTKRVNEWIKE